MRKIITILIFCSFVCHAKERLIEYAQNMYSQFGEDGIIKKIFEIIGPESKLAVEFGAWDGIHLSNTAKLWIGDLSWRAVLIEGNVNRFEQLAKTAAQFNVLAVCAWVGIEKADCLEAVLEKFNITEPIDLLSIDVDGNDYHIFNSLEKIRPRVIICEYNPTIPIHYDVFAPYCSNNNFGSSAAALARIAQTKGYKLVALTTVNAFFIRENEFEKFNNFETDFRSLNVNDGYITLVTTYDGKYALIKNEKEIYFYGVTSQMDLPLQGKIARCDRGPMNLGFGIRPQYSV